MAAVCPVNLVSIRRKSAVLTPSDLPCLKKVASINVSSGCAHGCIYCYAQTYSQTPPRGTVHFYANTAAKLKDEWPRKRKEPDNVYFCPSSDLFQPIAEILDAGYEMLTYILRQGKRVSITTKGDIPEKHLALLCEYAEQVHVQIGLITHDEKIRRIVEPNAASVAARVSHLRRLAAAGVDVKLRVAPILPGITDDDQTLSQLCTIARDGGLHDIIVNTLHLRPGLKDPLQQALPPELAARLFGAYDCVQRQTLVGRYKQTSLPAEERQRLFTHVKGTAKGYGLRAHICGCMNPDISDERCSLAGQADDGTKERQMSLLDSQQ